MDINLGFGPNTIAVARQIYNAEGRWVPKLAQQLMGPYYNDYNIVSQVKYCVQLLSNPDFTDNLETLKRTQVFDELPVEQLNALSKHYLTMKNKFGIGSEYLINDQLWKLADNNFNNYVVLRNLTAPFDIYNKGHDEHDKYILEKKNNKKCFIKTKKHPYAKREEDLQGNPNIKIEKDEYEEGYYNLEVNNENVGILNKVAIFVSTKVAPVIHCGEYALVTSSGNKIYIYALEFNDLKYNQKMERKAGQFNNASVIVGSAYDKKGLQDIMNKTLNWFKSNLDVRYYCGVRPEHEFEEKVNWIVDLGDEDMDSSAFEDFFSSNSSDNNSSEADSLDDILDFKF